MSYSTDAPAIANYISEENPEMAIVDSVQTIELPTGASTAGSVKQVKESAQIISHSSKGAGTVLILIGQVTKSGAIAGPKNLEHLVDTVLYIEGDKSSDLRIVRCKKNRFGISGIASVFKMTRSGLQEVKDPSSAFLSSEDAAQIGVARTVALEEQLPIGIEVQALTSHTAFSLPKRVATGIRTNKLYLIIGVIQKYSSIKLGDDDVYINVAGGIWAKEPGTDLSIAAATISSALNIPIPPDMFFIGEIELSGKVRRAINHKERLEIAKQCGSKRVISDNIKSVQGLVKAIKRLKK